MIGVDIVKISRIKKIIGRFGKRFINKFFHQSEISQSLKLCKKLQANYLAKRFAAKEAFLKSKGTGIGLKFAEICVKNNKQGKPIIFYQEKEQEKVNISLSDDGDYAIAFVTQSPC